MRRLPHPRTKFCIGNICCGVKSTLSDSGLPFAALNPAKSSISFARAHEAPRLDAHLQL
jgi:hypothetical protein